MDKYFQRGSMVPRIEQYYPSTFAQAESFLKKVFLQTLFGLAIAFGSASIIIAIWGSDQMVRSWFFFLGK